MKNYTPEEYNILYANTLAYLRNWQKKFIHLFVTTQNRSQKEAFEYLKIIKDFIKKYDLSIDVTLKRTWFYVNNHYKENIKN